MIPLRDTIPSQRTAWIVRLLVAANLALFVVEILQGLELESFLYRFGVVPAYWASGGLADLAQWPGLFLSLLTTQFLHGSPLHLGSNMLYLWIFGDNVEDRLGHAGFLLLYLGSGAVAALIQLLSAPSSSIPMIGASGAIAGVLGAYFLLFPYAQVVTLVPWFLVWKVVRIPAFVFLGIWFILQWLQGLVTIGQMAETGGVAWWAHVGGFLCGLALVLTRRARHRRAG